MDIKKIIVNGKEYEFVNSSRSTRNGFAHDTTLFVNGYEKTSNTCHYLNRTWECYRYQTVMMGAIRQSIDNRTNLLERKFKDDNGYKKMTADRVLKFKNVILADDDVIKEYKKVLKQLENY